MKKKNSNLNNKKTITMVPATFNESENIEAFILELLEIRKKLNNFKVDFIIIDNASTDRTIEIIKKFTNKYKFIRVIINTRNFGHIRSPYYGIIQSKSDATIYLASDFQDPLELIFDFIKSWQDGYKLVLGIKKSTKEKSFLIKQCRFFYYFILSKISNSPHIANSTGFGLYSKEVLDHVRAINDPYPYLRGIIGELGFEPKEIYFSQSLRNKGKSKNNIFSLIDFALLGIVNQSTILLRTCSILGFTIGVFSILIGAYYLIYKLLYWDSFVVGFAPLIIITSLTSGLILFFVGILGEYIALILRYQKNLPIVVEKERINFTSK